MGRQGEHPEDRRHHPGPEPPVLRRLAHDRPVQRLLRAPVPGVHDQVAGVRGEVHRGAADQGRAAAGVPRPRRRRPGAQAGRAGAARRRLRDRLPGGHRVQGPGPVADGGQDGRGPAGADHRGAGDPDRALGRAGDPALRDQEAAPVPAQDGADGGRAAGGPVRLRRASGSALRRCGPRPPTSWPTSPPCWPRSGRRRRPPHRGISRRAAGSHWTERAAVPRLLRPGAAGTGEAGSRDEAASGGS